MSDPFRINGVGIEEVAGLGRAAEAPATGKADSSVFDELLSRAAEAVISPQAEATKAVEAFNHGAEGRIHETLLTVDKAEISLKLLVGVRNRLLDAYREVMRMGG